MAKTIYRDETTARKASALEQQRAAKIHDRMMENTRVPEPKNPMAYCDTVMSHEPGRQIPTALEELARSVSVANEFLEQLRDRLGPHVLRNSTTEDCHGSDGPRACKVGLAEQIDLIAAVSDNNRRIVTDILDRLEL
jgi:hypothetical protein